MDRKVIMYRDQWVFRRDKWKCQMPACLHPEEDGGRAIDPMLYRRNSPWAPSVDHIVPKSRGGTGQRDNLRAAHKRCNAEWGNAGSIPDDYYAG